MWAEQNLRVPPDRSGKMKKILSLVFAVSLLLSASAVRADTGSLNNEMQALKDNGIIIGDPDGDFRPDDELTRAEFAAILCRAMGVEKIAKSPEMAGKGYFTDVSGSHWAAGHINTAADYGAINGFGDGTFRPETTVTNEQVVKMLVAAWGYAGEAEKLGEYPNGYMEVAAEYGVTDTVAFNYGVASKRWVAGAFVYGALTMPVHETAALEIPFDFDPIRDGAARPENTEYIDDPVSILKRITPESAKYERKVFEQQVQTDKFPFVLQGDIIAFQGENAGNAIGLSVSGGDSKEPVAEGFFEGNSFGLSGVPEGTWNLSVCITDGTVRDTYFTTLEKKGGSLSFVGEIFRYTTLNAQPAITEVRHEMKFTAMQGSGPNPFVLEIVPDDASAFALRVSCPVVFEEGVNFNLSMNTNDESLEPYCPPMHIEGESYDEGIHSAPIDVKNKIIVSNLEAEVKYHIQISVRDIYGDDIVLKGDIVFSELDGGYDYLFDGFLRTLRIDGFEIRDYEI